MEIFNNIFNDKKSVPLILQHEIAECALACVAMISSYYGREINMFYMRDRFNVSTHGMNVSDIVYIAGDLGLTTRALRCELKELPHLKLPCILHWDMCHFVVLTKVIAKKIVINNPAIGVQVLSIKECGCHFTGVALELKPRVNFEVRKDKTVLKIKNLWGEITDFKLTLISIVLLSLVYQLTSLSMPYYMQWIVDDVLINNDTQLLLVIAIGFIIIAIINFFTKALRNWILLRASSMFAIQIGSNLFGHLIRLPISFFKRRQLGDIVSKFNSVIAIKDILAKGIIESIVDGSMSIITLLIMVMYSPTLTFIVILTIFVFARYCFYFSERKITHEGIKANATEDSIFIETIRSMQTIKLNSNEYNRQALWLNSYMRLINAEIKIGSVTLGFELISDFIFGVSNIIVIYIGATSVISGNLTIGMLLAFIAYNISYIEVVKSLTYNFIKFKMLSIHLDRVSDIALQKIENYTGLGKMKIENITGKVTINRVSFTYGDNKLVLNDISFEVKAGEFIAIVGPSGCGKSTLLKIILGLYKPTSGEVLIDDIAAKDFGDDFYRKIFSCVMQDDSLLAGTVAENITFFDSNADIEWMKQCAIFACIHDEIMSLAMEYNSLVGDLGCHFSGGQMQRILLARALYKRPRILCLDEATSYLDSNNERKINHAIQALGITRIIIAHREETIKSADYVVVLKV